MDAALAEIINDPAIDLVVEAAGGLDDARTVVFSSLEKSVQRFCAEFADWSDVTGLVTTCRLAVGCRGKHVVTANKALLATYLEEVIALCAAPTAGKLGFEAAVAGGKPQRGVCSGQVNEPTCDDSPPSLSRPCPFHQVFQSSECCSSPQSAIAIIWCVQLMLIEWG